MEDNKPQPGAFLVYGCSEPEEKNQLTPEQMEGLKLLYYASTKELDLKLITLAILVGVPLLTLIVCIIIKVISLC